MTCFFGGFHIGLSGPLIPYLRFLPQIWPWCRITATAIQSHNELSRRGGGVEGEVWLGSVCAHGRAVMSQPIFSWADQRALGGKKRGGGNISPHGNIRGSFQMDASELSYSQRQRIISSSLFRLVPISSHWGDDRQASGPDIKIFYQVQISCHWSFKRATSYKKRHPFLRCIT